MMSIFIRRFIVGAVLMFVSPLLYAFNYHPILGINYDNSQGLALEAGAIVEIRGTGGWSSSASGIALSFEPGIKGNKMHVGYGRFIYGIGGMVGYRATWTMLSVNDDFNNYSADEDYSGIELFVGATIVSVQLGYFQGQNTKDKLFSFGVGVGF